MYKVFIKEVLFLFTDQNNILSGFDTVLYQELNLQLFFNEIQQNPETKINVICDNLQKDWLKFLQNFQIREAAGGVVKNKAQKILWIYRFDKWDLPKGHIEKGESKEVAAIREVEEECSIFGLSIQKELQTTYHVFELKNKKIIKITYWFLMNVDNNGEGLVPQIDEGITDVCFKTRQQSLECVSNTYGNVKLLLQEVL